MKVKVIDKSQAIGIEEWINKETGEVKEFAVVEKKVTGDTNWWKLWISDLLGALGLIGNVKMKVLMYIMENINPYDNTFGGTIREIADACEASPTTVQKVLHVLINDANFLVKIRAATYQVNPDIMAKGSHKKRIGLMVKYNKAKDKKEEKIT